jgi:tRNA (guanine-N7-)-methyltransferase
LSPRQQALLEHALPSVALDLTGPPPERLTELFGGSVQDIWLEIGFGDGRHLLRQAERNANVGIIGCEPFVDGVVKVLSAIEERKLGNLRLFAGDARELLRWLPEGSIGRLFVLFPDPWPKRRHSKRRLLGPSTMALLTRCMRTGAELRIATDSGSYVRAILLAVAAQPGLVWQLAGPEDWRRRGADWPATKYEQKAAREERKSYFLCFRRS